MKNIRDFIEAYILEKESDGRSRATLENYRIRLNCFANFLKENYNTDDILTVDRSTIIAYKRYLLEIKNNKINSLKVKTVELRQFFNYVCDQKGMEDFENPMLNIKSPKGEVVSKKFFYVKDTKDFIEKSIEIFYCDKNNRKPYGIDKKSFRKNIPIIITALTTAARVSSIINVRFSDYNPVDRTITFRFVKGGGHLVKYLQPFVVDLIEKYIKEIRPQGLPENAPLFVRERRHSINPNIKSKVANVYKDKNTGKEYTEMGRVELTFACKKYTKMIAGKELSMHELRHSSAMFVFENGGSVADIKQILGHKNAVTTENYLHSLENKREKEIMDKLWSGIILKQ